MLLPLFINLQKVAKLPDSFRGQKHFKINEFKFLCQREKMDLYKNIP